MNKDKKKQENTDIVDSVLRSSYAFISEGRGLTNSLAKVDSPYKLRVLPQYIPEGEDDAAQVTIGQINGMPLVVELWEEAGKVRVKTKMWEMRILEVDLEEADLLVKINFAKDDLLLMSDYSSGLSQACLKVKA